jgi:1-acyl-sn-glycerol-3-phosphate acyltransferase
MSRLHKPKAGFWIRLCVVVIYPLAGWLYRIRWAHLDRIPPPATGGVIFAINHVSNLDTLAMARLVWQGGRIPRFMVKSGLFGYPVVGRILRGAQQIPVYRGTTDAAGSLRAAVDALGRGEAIVIYPEGTYSRDPQQWPMQGKTGIARLVLLCPEIPVIPIGQWGAQRQRLSAGRLLRRRPVTASVGAPLDLRRHRGQPPRADTLREITDEVMTAVRCQVAEARGEQAPTEFFKLAHRVIDRR